MKVLYLENSMRFVSIIYLLSVKQFHKIRPEIHINFIVAHLEF